MPSLPPARSVAPPRVMPSISAAQPAMISPGLQQNQPMPPTAQSGSRRTFSIPPHSLAGTIPTPNTGTSPLMHPLVPISSYVPTPTAIRSPLLLPPRPASQPVSTDPAVDPVTRSATQPPQTARRMTQTFASQPISFEPQTSNHISHNINQLPQLSVPPLGFNLQITTTTKTSAGTGGSEFAYSDAKLG